MSVNDVANLLHSWGMSDDIVDKFKENEVDESALLKLPPHIIADLIVKVGPRFKFLDYLEQYKKIKLPKDSGTNFEPSQEKRRRIEESSVVPVQCIDICSISADDLQNAEVVTSGVSTADASIENLLNHSDSRIPSSARLEKYDINEILSNYTTGLSALKYFQLNKKLDDFHRNIIAQCLIDYELKGDLNKRFTGERAKFIAENIVEFFNVNGKTESEITWYNPKQKSFKGKLIGRYHNVRRKLLKEKVIEKKSKSDELDFQSEFDQVDEDEASDDTSNYLLWLKNNIAPWPKVLDIWKKTTQGRVRILHSEKEPVHKYIETYLPLKESQALSLFEIDFEYLYPAKGLNLYNEFPKLMLFVDDKLTQKKIKNYVPLTSINGDLQVLNLFDKLHLLFPVITCQTKKSKNWRPSREEIKDGFILKVNTFGDIKPTLNIRRAKLAKMSLNLQPQPVIVGTDLSNITEQFVSIDNLLYPVESPIKAIDLTFKTVHALHAKYTPEAESIWLFLQVAVYKIKTKWDRKLAAVETLIQEYQVFTPKEYTT